MYDFFLEDLLQNFVKNYVQAEYSSQGALIRVLMNLVPATLVLTVGSRLGFSDTERKLWRNFALASLALLVLVLVSPSTTAVDRIALYILPIQIAVLSRVPRGLMSEGPGKTRSHRLFVGSPVRLAELRCARGLLGAVPVLPLVVRVSRTGTPAIARTSAGTLERRFA